MKNWYFVQDCTNSRSEIYDEILPAKSKEDAFECASAKWEAISETDRRKTDEAFIGFADVDEFGCVDYNTMTDIVYLKERA